MLAPLVTRSTPPVAPRSVSSKPAPVKPAPHPAVEPPRRRRRVLLVMQWLDYELDLGIAEYARVAGWLIDDTPTHTGHPPRDWACDGIIALLRDRGSEIVDFVTRASVPAVDLAAELADLPLPRVLADNESIGRAAAAHLLACGLHHLAFLNVWDSHVERERMSGFRKAVEETSRTFHPLEFHGPKQRYADTDHLLDWLVAELRRLPRPLGAMGRHDRASGYILQACEVAGLRVPDEVAVVGSDNDPPLCELGSVPLSSVDNRRRDHGLKAAALLERLMDGEAAPAAPLRVPVGPVIVRYSSEVLAVPHEDVSRAEVHCQPLPPRDPRQRRRAPRRHHAAAAVPAVRATPRPADPGGDPPPPPRPGPPPAPDGRRQALHRRPRLRLRDRPAAHPRPRPRGRHRPGLLPQAEPVTARRGRAAKGTT